jgi:hypothetical protein
MPLGLCYSAGNACIGSLLEAGVAGSATAETKSVARIPGHKRETWATLG